MKRREEKRRIEKKQKCARCYVMLNVPDRQKLFGDTIFESMGIVHSLIAPSSFGPFSMIV